jgi:hypothetical protein
VRRRLLAVAMLCGAGGCAAAPPVPPPAVEYPTDAFPAPPGFAGERLADDRWEFHGRGRTDQAALYFQVSCVEFLGWRQAADRTVEGDGRVLEFTRGAERLRVEVRAGSAVDTLRVLVSLARDAAPTPESTRGHVAAPAARSRD